MMTGTAALVLAALSLTGACPSLCPTPDAGVEEADLLPELPDPSPLEEAEVAKPGAPLETTRVRDLVDELTRARLPGDPSGLTSSALEEPILGAEPAMRSAPAPAPEPAGETPEQSNRWHETAPRSQQPQASGTPAHASTLGPQAQGEPVGDPASRLVASLLVGLASIGLYHKLTKDRALEHPTRRRILSMLEEEPGLGTTDVADRLDVCYRTARHHLEVLARFDLVVRAEQAAGWRWARPEDASEARVEQVPEIQQRMIELLEQDPGLHLSEIARRLDAAKATVKLHLDRLDEQGAVRDERVGPLRRFFPEAERSA